MPEWQTEAKTLIQAGKGIRESARLLGLPEERVKKWAQREGIRSQMVAAAFVPKAMSPQVKIVPNVPTAGDILQRDAETLGPDARHISARIGHSALSHVERVMDADPERGLVQLDSALTAGKLLQTANVPGWERQQQAGTGVSLLVAGNAQVLIQGPSAPD